MNFCTFTVSEKKRIGFDIDRKPNIFLPVQPRKETKNANLNNIFEILNIYTCFVKYKHLS